MQNYPMGEELRLMLLGKTGSGKSSLANALMQADSWFSVATGLVSGTQRCQREASVVRGRFLSVVDTPGTMDTSQPELALQQLSLAIAMFAEHGVHAFVITLRLDVRFTEEEARAVQILVGIFGEQFFRYVIFAFTHGDHVENSDAKFFDHIRLAGEDVPQLRDLLNRCDQRIVVVDNGRRCDKMRQSEQTWKLVMMADELVSRNKSDYNRPTYTNEYFVLAQREIQSAIDRVARQHEERLQKAVQREREKLRREYDQRLNEVMKQAIDEATEAVARKIREDENACFPSGAMVRTPDGPTPINLLSVGQSVLCSYNNKLIYSPVYMWGHRDETTCSNSFVTITTESAQLTLSSDHLLPIIDEMGDEVSVPAGEVSSGNTVQVLHHMHEKSQEIRSEKVLSVETGVNRAGLFAPFTMCGTVIVDDVVASCYIRCLPHGVSHALLWPVRVGWRFSPAAVSFCNELGSDGMCWWVSVISNRALPMVKWLGVGSDGKSWLMSVISNGALPMVKWLRFATTKADC